nr:immunoglobulin heavy chain junction region [Mus musculus]
CARDGSSLFDYW